jgi:hypothetical protein
LTSYQILYRITSILVDLEICWRRRINTNANNLNRGNPSVLSKAAQCFTYIVKALEAETIQGQTATRIVGAAKVLVSAAGLDAGQLLATMSPETQQTVRAFFG